MNRRQLEKLGVPPRCIKSAIAAVQRAAAEGGLRGPKLKEKIREVLEHPSLFVGDLVASADPDLAARVKNGVCVTVCVCVCTKN